MSTKSAMIRARMTPELKKQAEGVFGKLGITATEAINMFYSQVVRREGLPFEVSVEEKAPQSAAGGTMEPPGGVNLENGANDRKSKDSKKYIIVADKEEFKRFMEF